MIRICKFCKKKYKTRPSKLLKYCSHVCYSKSLVGRVPWNKGIPISKEQKEKMKISLKGKQKWLGKKHTEKSKLIMSLSHKGKKLTKEHIKNSLRRRLMSTLEIKVNNVIKKYNLPYKFVGNGKFFIERKNPDFININGKKIAIEVYCRKHKDLFKGSCSEWKKERSNIFKKYGWSIIFIEDWQTNNEETLLKILKQEI